MTKIKRPIQKQTILKALEESNNPQLESLGKEERLIVPPNTPKIKPQRSTLNPILDITEEDLPSQRVSDPEVTQIVINNNINCCTIS